MNQINQEIAKAIKKQDLEMYQQLRYQHYSDGEELAFKDFDFSETDFSLFNCGFWIFERCNLSKTKGFSGQPIVIKNCQAQEIDLRNTVTVIEAENSDFSDAIIDRATCLANSDPSIFVNCKIDAKTAEKFIKAGANIN